MPPLCTTRNLPQLVLIVAFIMTQGVAAGMAAFAVRALFEALHDGTPLPVQHLVLLGGSGVVIAAAGVGAAETSTRLGQQYSILVRAALFRHAARMPLGDVVNRRGGYMSLRFVADMSALRSWLAEGIPRCIAASILLPITWAVLYALHPAFGYSVIPFSLASVALTAVAGRQLVPLFATLRQRRAKIAADMAERMPLAPELDRLNRYPVEAKRLQRAGFEVLQSAVVQVRLVQGLQAAPEVMSSLAMVTLLWIGHRDGLSTGTVAAGLAALGICLTPLRELVTVWCLRAEYVAAVGKCRAALARAQRPRPSVKDTTEPGPVAVHCHNVTRGPLQQWSMQVPAGGFYSLTGLTAGEEMCVFRLLQGLEVPDHGQVLLGGQVAWEVNPARVALISAEPVVLRGSMRRVLTLGQTPRPSDAVIGEAVAQVGLSQAVERLGGLRAKVAEGGRNMPLGERAQVSAAQALLQRPDVVLVCRSAILLPSPVRQVLHRWLVDAGCTVVAAGAVLGPHIVD